VASMVKDGKEMGLLLWCWHGRERRRGGNEGTPSWCLCTGIKEGEGGNACML
jgi:hypothetical protein